MKNNKQCRRYHLYSDDLPNHALDQIVHFKTIAIDTETTGLKLYRDRLCLVQLCLRNEIIYLIEINVHPKPAPNLCYLLQAKNILKIYHFARFDVSMLYKTYGLLSKPIFCSKIASKLARTNSQHHSLSDLCLNLLQVKLEKVVTHTDWANNNKTPRQFSYACNDVLYLHQLYDKLSMMLRREGRWNIAQSCMKFLPQRALLDVIGFEEGDIFAHH